MEPIKELKSNKSINYKSGTHTDYIMNYMCTACFRKQARKKNNNLKR